MACFDGRGLQRQDLVNDLRDHGVSRRNATLKNIRPPFARLGESVPAAFSEAAVLIFGALYFTWEGESDGDTEGARE